TFRQILERCNVIQSFSQKGYPYDNACCESFFRHMKRECINRKAFRNQGELRLCCFEYINRYNTKRPHSSLGDYTPDEIEQFYMERQEYSCLSIKIYLKSVSIYLTMLLCRLLRLQVRLCLLHKGNILY
ncbi:Integrase core domain-containing protein, partial [Peptostreptococcaceae bacterium pGA-8]